MHFQMAQLQIFDTVGLLLQERGAGLRKQLYTGEKSPEVSALIVEMLMKRLFDFPESKHVYDKTKRTWMPMISFPTQMWFKHIKANEVVNGATAVDLRAGFGDKSYGSIVLTKYKVTN